MNNYVRMPAVDLSKLAVHVIDSDERRLHLVSGLVQSMFPDNTVEVREARNPEVVRQKIQLMSEGDSRSYKPKKYNIFLSRENFDSFNGIFGSRQTDFDKEA